MFSKTPASLSLSSLAEATFRTQKWSVCVCVCVSVASCVFLCGYMFAGDKEHVCYPVWGELLSWKKVRDGFSCQWTTDGGELIISHFVLVVRNSRIQIGGSTLVSEILFRAACLFSLVPASLALWVILLPRLPLRGVTFSRDFRTTVRNS